jgi:hypothetical protein
MAQSCENKNFNPAEERGMKRPVEQALRRMIDGIRRTAFTRAANVTAGRDLPSYRRQICGADCAAAAASGNY